MMAAYQQLADIYHDAADVLEDGEEKRELEDMEKNISGDMES